MSRTKIFGISTVFLGTVLAVGMVACGNKEPNAKPAPEPPADPSGAAAPTMSPAPEGGKYEVVEVKDGGSVSGMVKWQGAKPEVKMLDLNKDEPTCGKHGKQRPSEDVIVNDKGGVKNAVVTLDVKKGAAFKADQPIVFDQHECLFLSHVSVVPVGSTIQVKNSDDILHNTHFWGTKNKNENKAIPAGKTDEYKITYAETIKVNCDIHPWMSAWVLARDNPYYAITDENGNYSIKNVPPGKYKASVWQETAGRSAGPDVEVKTGADAKADLEVKAPPQK